MALETLEELHFFRILNSMLRHESTEEELVRTESVMQWVAHTRDTLDQVVNKTQLRLIMLIWREWRETKSTPILTSLYDLIRLDGQSGAMLEMMNRFERSEKDLVVQNGTEMEHHLNVWVKEFEKERLDGWINNMSQILTSALPNPDKKMMATKPTLQGIDDAFAYLMTRVNAKGLHVKDARAQYGALKDHTQHIEGLYSKNLAEKESGQMFIGTGINLIDQHMGGLRNKDFNAILGYTGQRKTAVLRTMGYTAAMRGFKVMHIPLESDFNEEMIAYLIMHAHNEMWKGQAGSLSRQDFESGNMSNDQRHFLMKVVLPDFNATVAANIHIYEPRGARTWADVKSAIERECMIGRVDLVLIDYLTILTPTPDPNIRDKNAAMITMIQDAKQLCMTANDGEGLCLVTPVQGSRKGLDEASLNEGAWDVTGISTYSEMDKSLDNCFYVYMTDGMSSLDQLKFGSCKMRRNKNIVCSFLRVDPCSGIVSTPADFSNSRTKATGRAASQWGPSLGESADLSDSFCLPEVRRSTPVSEQVSTELAHSGSAKKIAAGELERRFNLI